MKKYNWTSRAVASAMCVAVATAFVFGCKPSENRDKGNALNSNVTEEAVKALDADEWTRAYDKFTDAIAADDKNVDSYYGRASAALNIAKGHYSLAQAAATNNDIETGTAEAQKADEYFQKAIDDCDKILTLAPNFADAYFVKGIVAQYQGAWEKGIEAFSECVKLEPERAEAYHRRAEIYDNTGDYMNASVDFKKASELGYSDGTESTAEETVDLEDFSDLNYDANLEEGSQDEQE